MRNWTLFLDRDGVLNEKIENGYVTTPGELKILAGIPQAISQLSKFFSRIFIVTNQRGIARGLYTVEDLNRIHEALLSAIRQAGGRIDKIYYCPHDKEECDCRKPLVGMALQAKRDFPKISFKHSFMVGDSLSDMEFGSTLKMKTVYLTRNLDANSSDYRFQTLSDFAKFIESRIENKLSCED